MRQLRLSKMRQESRCLKYAERKNLIRIKSLAVNSSGHTHRQD